MVHSVPPSGRLDRLKNVLQTQPARATAADSWRLTGVGPTLAMALARRWLGVGQFLCSCGSVGI
jgi:hypothetical protein